MWSDSQSEKVRFGLLLILLAACFLMGGGSRQDITSLILLQPIAILCATGLLLLPGRPDWEAIRVPLLLLGGLAGIMVAQIIPLPPEVWAKLPGRSPFVQSAILAGIPQPWRPISLKPDFTLGSFVGLGVPFAVLIGFASVNDRRRRVLLLALIIGVVVSALFGLAQVSGRAQSLYLYKITNQGAAVGLFANRNHQALLLAMAWPMLAVWAMTPHKDVRHRTVVRSVAAALALFLLPLLLVTGSRAGLVLGLIGLSCAAGIWHRHASGMRAPHRRFERYIPIFIGLAGTILLLTSIILSRAEAIQRVLKLDVSADTRVEVTPILMDMVRDFFPMGAGFGSFDPVFRYYEPVQMLNPEYLNHAHNDLLELVIEAGLPGGVLGLVFLGWFVLRSISVWRLRGGGMSVTHARLASVMILLVLCGSFVDYALRTPLMMAVFAIACGWLAPIADPEESG